MAHPIQPEMRPGSAAPAADSRLQARIDLVRALGGSVLQRPRLQPAEQAIQDRAIPAAQPPVGAEAAVEKLVAQYLHSAASRSWISFCW